MSSLSLQVYDEPGGNFLYDWSDDVAQLSSNTGPHGYEALSGIVVLSPNESYRFYDVLDVLHVVLSDGAFIIFEGRLEDVAVVDAGIQFTALGYYQAYSDVPYTALWSDTLMTRWQVAPEETDVSVRLYNGGSNITSTDGPHPSKYQYDFNNRIYVAMREGEDYRNPGTSQNDACVFYYEVPDDGEKDIKEVTFDYDVDIKLDMTLGMVALDSSFAYQEQLWMLTGASSSTGSVTATLTTAKPIVALYMVQETNFNPYTETLGTGRYYAIFDNIRVKSVSTATITADDIIKEIVTYVDGVNGDQVTDSAVWIDDPVTDLNDEYYDDEIPARLFDRFALVGDDQKPPNRFEIGVYENRLLHFRKRGDTDNVNEWALEFDNILNVRRTLQDMYNSVYSVYNEPKEQLPLRTTISTDSVSTEQNKITRRYALRTVTTDSTQADTQRDAFLDDNEKPTPQTSIKVRHIYPLTGGEPIRPYYIRSGDRVTVRSIPPNSTGLDKIREFIVSRTEYDPINDIMTIIPEKDLPTLETLVAQALEQNR